MKEGDSPPIALALSGGGIRAMIFHLGVLRYLAEVERLEAVERISTVSGGSLIIGLIFREAAMTWPTSNQFLKDVHHVLRDKLCSRSLQMDAVRQLVRPTHWRFLLSRANLLAAALRESWGITGKVADLPARPEWSINGTTAENGKRFRFKRDTIGDYKIGYAHPHGFGLAEAVAVSAAFPGGFGPLALDVRQFDWWKREWDAEPGSEERVTPEGTVLHLYDGGVYDNIGIEPFFDSGKLQAKQNDVSIVVSDASAPLRTGFKFGPINPFRLKRVADITSDQAHALRVRTFVSYLQGGIGRGAFIYISSSGSSSRRRADSTFAREFPTSLRRLRAHEFDTIERHGYHTAEDVARDFGPI